MHVKIEKAAAWSTLVMLVVFGVTFGLIAGVLPPINPGFTAEQTAQWYIDNHFAIRLGLGLTILGMWFMTPVFALLCRQVRRIEGYWGVMSITEVILSVTFPFVFTLAMVFGVAAAYRPDRDPQATSGTQRHVLASAGRHRRAARIAGADPRVGSVHRQARRPDIPALVRIPQPVDGATRPSRWLCLRYSKRAAGLERNHRVVDSGQCVLRLDRPDCVPPR